MVKNSHSEDALKPNSNQYTWLSGLGGVCVMGGTWYLQANAAVKMSQSRKWEWRTGTLSTSFWHREVGSLWFTFSHPKRSRLRSSSLWFRNGISLPSILSSPSKPAAPAPTSKLCGESVLIQMGTWQLTTGLDVAYLFWETQYAHFCHCSNFFLTISSSTDATAPLSPPASPLLEESNHQSLIEHFNPNEAVLNDENSVVIPVAIITPYLDKALSALGLHTEARTSFITFVFKIYHRLQFAHLYIIIADSGFLPSWSTNILHSAFFHRLHTKRPRLLKSLPLQTLSRGYSWFFKPLQRKTYRVGQRRAAELLRM